MLRVINPAVAVPVWFNLIDIGGDGERRWSFAASLVSLDDA
ncbi:MAG: hypothetical protein ACJ8FZ_16795 [Bradyrhizobium sp.]